MTGAVSVSDRRWTWPHIRGGFNSDDGLKLRPELATDLNSVSRSGSDRCILELDDGLRLGSMKDSNSLSDSGLDQ